MTRIVGGGATAYDTHRWWWGDRVQPASVAVWRPRTPGPRRCRGLEKVSPKGSHQGTVRTRAGNAFAGPEAHLIQPTVSPWVRRIAPPVANAARDAVVAAAIGDAVVVIAVASAVVAIAGASLLSSTSTRTKPTPRVRKTVSPLGRHPLPDESIASPHNAMAFPPIHRISTRSDVDSALRSRPQGARVARLLRRTTA